MMSESGAVFGVPKCETCRTPYKSVQKAIDCCGEGEDPEQKGIIIFKCRECSGRGDAPLTFEIRDGGMPYSPDLDPACPVCGGRRLVERVPCHGFGKIDGDA